MKVGVATSARRSQAPFRGVLSALEIPVNSSCLSNITMQAQNCFNSFKRRKFPHLQGRVNTALKVRNLRHHLLRPPGSGAPPLSYLAWPSSRRRTRAQLSFPRRPSHGRGLRHVSALAAASPAARTRPAPPFRPAPVRQSAMATFAPDAAPRCASDVASASAEPRPNRARQTMHIYSPSLHNRGTLASSRWSRRPRRSSSQATRCL